MNTAPTTRRPRDIEHAGWGHVHTRGALRAHQTLLGATPDGSYSVYACEGTRIVLVRYQARYAERAALAVIVDHDDHGRITQTWWMRPWSVWTGADERGRILDAVTTLLQRRLQGPTD
jgi:hypothetical protein